MDFNFNKVLISEFLNPAAKMKEFKRMLTIIGWSARTEHDGTAKWQSFFQKIGRLLKNNVVDFRLIFWLLNQKIQNLGHLSCFFTDFQVFRG